MNRFFCFFLPLSPVDGATKNTSTENVCRIRNFFLRILKVFSWGAQVCDWVALTRRPSGIDSGVLQGRGNS